MTFNNVMSYLKSGNAAYTPSMKGYFYREDDEPTSVSTKESSSTDTYTVTKTEKAHFVFKENKSVTIEGITSDSVSEYDFTRITTTVTTYLKSDDSQVGDPVETVTWKNPNMGKVGVTAKQPLELDSGLFQHLASSEWETSTKAEAEARKTSLNADTRW